jgi:sulfate adenylyltransferase
MSFELIDEKLVSKEKKLELQKKIPDLKSWDLTPRQLCDLELIMNGGFSPLKGFLNESDYNSVCENLRLKSGELWAMPITLDVSEAFAGSLAKDEEIVLRDLEGVPLAILKVESNWQPDKAKEAELVFGKNDTAHPAVNYLHSQAGSWYLGGEIFGLEMPKHYDYISHRHTPNELRSMFNKNGWDKIVAFQTRNPMHRAHYELTLRAVKEQKASLLLHPVVGMTKPGDIDHYTRVRCYEQIIKKYPEQTSALSLLPLAMRMGGPREALWHAQIRNNYGATHFIVGRDHAGPGKDSLGEDFYDPYAAQVLVEKYADEIGVQVVPFKAVVYVENKAEYHPADEVEETDKILNISGTEFRRRLRNDLDIPSWFSFPDVITELKKSYPAKHKQGFTIFFTGLSGAGKSTIANALMIKLLEHGDRPVTLLDGDIVRKNLSSELSFSKEHRDLNIMRIGYVASEITKHRGIAICAPIAPYAKTRQAVRNEIEQFGGFIEVHVSTSLEVCESRDRKGLYEKARKGIIKHFTGIDDPYEVPTHAEIIVDTTKLSVMESVQHILLEIESMGYLLGN